MDSKTLRVLEYDKILARLAAHCDYQVARELARQLRPTPSFEKAQHRQQETSEARRFLSTHEAGVGGARDVRPLVEMASRGGVLESADLIDIKDTLISMRQLKAAFGKSEALPHPYPHLEKTAQRLPPTLGLVDAISRTVSEKGEVLDSASPKLASIRAEMRVAHERLMSKLQKYISNAKTAAILQDALITQRDGRYVIPLRAEFKGRIKGIVHDQSASGATLFIEPLPVVELNNRVRELQLAERDEIRRVLAELSTQIGAHADEIHTGVEALADLDLAFAKAKYAEELDAAEPLLVEGSEKPAASPSSHLPTIKLVHARHPLLDPQTVVPIDVALEPNVRALVITGPNTGGKTVTLKTVGLLALMAQSGLHIPAQSGSELPCFQAIYADIGDEQSIEQSLSTFSGHIKNITGILKKADERSLVILDELGAGTDPQEGAALARAILSYLLARGATTLVATHYPELKTFAHATTGVVNASLEFDIRTLRPTYRLTIGLPGRSNALAIAQRLGLPEEVLAAAKNDIDPDDLRADDLLGDIHRQRKIARKERHKAEKARIQAHRLRRELTERLEAIEDERREVLEKARQEAEAQIDALQAEIREMKRRLKKARQPLEAVESVREKVVVLEKKVRKPVERRAVKEAALSGPPKLGEKVHIRSLNTDGIVTTLGESEAEVQVGSLRIRAKLSDLRRKGGQTEDGRPETAAREPSSPVHRPPSVLPKVELDIRGQRADDALDMLDHYLEQAYLAGMPFVRVIHGKGTGALRQAVRQALQGHPHVTSFEEGRPQEGGAGVTVVHLAKD
ncbi:MAG: endonuclease MutS2 [Chloroflexi bacterium]|nr:endonuclease MutS2 [Chloroflexota bacterium]